MGTIVPYFLMTKPELFLNREEVTDPMVVIRHTFSKHDFHFESKIIKGRFYLVIPNTAREVMFLQLLSKNIDIFVPSEGEGLLIKEGGFT